MNALVIPCYNEERRLAIPEIAYLLEANENLNLVLVNDGSTDRTESLLRHIAKSYPRVTVLTLEQNQGKANAVRRGLLHLTTQNYAWIGYADADFSTPARELSRLLEVTTTTQAHAVLGSRVRLLGVEIERRVLRHYLGRVFATFASLALNLPVYDTQCGAKLFYNTDELRRALNEPFFSKWAFDVELIGRLNLIRPQAKFGTFVEIPLRVWRDVGGSKLGPTAMIKAGLDVLKIARDLRSRRRKPNAL